MGWINVPQDKAQRWRGVTEEQARYPSLLFGDLPDAKVREFNRT